MARKLERNRWSTSGLRPGEIPADALTRDLQTVRNTLSFWVCTPEDKATLERAALAIAASRDSVDRVDLAVIPRAELETNGVALARSMGTTPVRDLREFHCDAVGLDSARLVSIATSVASAISDKRVVRVTKATVEKLLLSAYKAGRLEVGELDDKLHESLRARADRSTPKA